MRKNKINKKARFQEIKNLEIDKLKESLTLTRALAFNFRFSAAHGKVVKSHIIRDNRRNAARILTAMKMKKTQNIEKEV